MASKSSGCSEKIYSEPPLWQKKEFKSSVVKIVDSPSSLPANSIFSDPADINPRDICERSSSDRFSAIPMMESMSARDVCITILQKELATEPELSQKLASNDNEKSLLFECTGCKYLEDPFKMLICDDCDKAFHLSCCKAGVRNIPQEKWYCQACSRKKPKMQSKKLGLKHEEPNPSQKPCQGPSKIEAMLSNALAYEIDTRIGKDFQAVVPEWSGPILGNEDEFPEPSKLDPAETIACLPEFKRNNVDNWLECKKVLETKAIYGKWRRAPLSAVQTDGWECSCAVVWDPMHGDCAVPQELPTAEVCKQVRCIEKEKKRLADEKKKKRKKRTR